MFKHLNLWNLLRFLANSCLYYLQTQIGNNDIRIYTNNFRVMRGKSVHARMYIALLNRLKSWFFNILYGNIHVAVEKLILLRWGYLTNIDNWLHIENPYDWALKHSHPTSIHNFRVTSLWFRIIIMSFYISLPNKLYWKLFNGLLTQTTYFFVKVVDNNIKWMNIDD